MRFCSAQARIPLNCQVGVFLAYASVYGHALIDRELCLLRCRESKVTLTSIARGEYRAYLCWGTRFTGRKRAAFLALTGAAAFAVVAGVIGLAGPAGASPATRRGPAAVTGTEHFQIMTTSRTATTLSAIAYGVFTAPGVDHSGQTVDTLVFPGGSIKIELNEEIGSGTGDSGCLSTGSQQGTYSLVGGTGKYKEISGHGKYTMSTLAITPKVKGACAQNATPLALQEVINASGPVKLP
jgi:hypothetical protein